MYAIIKHGQVLATGTLEQMFISNLFPQSDTPEWKQQHDVYEVVYPSYNPQLEQLVPQAPVVVGRQVTLHSVAPLPPPPEVVVPEILMDSVPLTTSQIADIQPADSVG